MAIFKIGGYTYRSEDIDPLTQGHLYQAISPLIADVLTMKEFVEASQAAAKAVQEGKSTADAIAGTVPDIADIKDVIQTLMSAWGKMSRDNVTFVVDTCMSVVMRTDGNGEPGQSWTPIWNAAAHKPMYKDIDFKTMMLICYNVLVGSLGNF